MNKHTILFLAANPIGTDKLALDREARAIQAELDRSLYRDRFDFQTRGAAQQSDLLRELSKLKPAVVHFSGHGGTHMTDVQIQESMETRDVIDLGARSGELRPGLYFEDADGQAQWVSAEALAQTFKAAGDSVKLVLLNACYTDAQAEALLSHVPCVIGVSGAIDDRKAKAFASGFYSCLGNGASLKEAYDGGAAMIEMTTLPEDARPVIRPQPETNADLLVLAKSKKGRGWVLLIGLISLVIFVLTAVLWRLFAQPSISARLNKMFPSPHGWFCFPDNNEKMIGIKRVSDRFLVDSPLNQLDVGDDDTQADYKVGERVPFGGRGGTGHVDTDVAGDDCPVWQQEAIKKWLSKQATPLAIKGKWLDERFKPGNWRCHPRFPYAVKVDLTTEQDLVYPFTNADGADGLKYGVGDDPVPPGDNVTLWLKGPIPSSDCPPEPARVFPAFGTGLINLEESYNNLTWALDDCEDHECIGTATKALRLRISRPSGQGYAMLNFQKTEGKEARLAAKTLTLKIKAAPANVNFIEVKLFDDPRHPIFFACPAPRNLKPLLISLSEEVLEERGVSLAHLKYFAIGVSQDAGSAAGGELQLTVLGVVPGPPSDADAQDTPRMTCETYWPRPSIILPPRPR